MARGLSLRGRLASSTARCAASRGSRWSRPLCGLGSRIQTSGHSDGATLGREFGSVPVGGRSQASVRDVPCKVRGTSKRSHKIRTTPCRAKNHYINSSPRSGGLESAATHHSEHTGMVCAGPATSGPLLGIAAEGWMRGADRDSGVVIMGARKQRTGLATSAYCCSHAYAAGQAVKSHRPTGL
jgi:hypothetical protein